MLTTIWNGQGTHVHRATVDIANLILCLSLNLTDKVLTTQLAAHTESPTSILLWCTHADNINEPNGSQHKTT